MNNSLRLPKNVTLINPSTVMLQCDVCGQQWSPNLLPGGRLSRGSKNCPNGCTVASAEFNQAKAIEDYTELSRRIRVGAYEERKSEHFETGTYPDDGVEESIDNLTELAARHDLEFIWDLGTKTWSLLPMSEETRVARQAAQEYQDTQKYIEHYYEGGE